MTMDSRLSPSPAGHVAAVRAQACKAPEHRSLLLRGDKGPLASGGDNT